MRYNSLGKSGLIVSELAFGTMNFGKARYAGVGGVSMDDARLQIAMCLERGINLFDTANIYSDGTSEEMLGVALGANRKNVLIATKVFGPMGPSPMQKGLSRRHIIESCEDSLRRLGTDWIDLFQAHGWDGLTPIEETVRAFDELIQAGKVRYVGCSNHMGWQLMKAVTEADRLGINRYIAQQIQYSLVQRDVETEILPCGIDQGLGSLIWSPLGQGYLSGKYAKPDRSGRLEQSGRLTSIDTLQGQAIIKTLEEVAHEHNGEATVAQIAIAWALHRPGISAAILGSKDTAQLSENLGTADLVLSMEEVERLNDVSALAIPYPRSHQLMSSPERNSAMPFYKKR
jgi:aryl-alcohol dehydrogenase-like predicted oxidoreductase